MTTSPRRLVIDARATPHAAALSLLGLTMLRRSVLAGRRSGFDAVTVLAPVDGVAPLQTLVAENPAEVVTRLAEAPNTVTVRVSADLLAERRWLEPLAAETVEDGDRRSAGPGIFVFGAGTPAAQIEDPGSANGPPTAPDPPPLRIAGEDDLEAGKRRLLAGMVKETDGFMSRHFARPISTALSRHLAPLGVTPNQMTVVSALIGIAAAPFFLSSAPSVQMIGGLLFVLHSVLDGCDGELARLTYRESRLGGLLDFWGDNIVHVAVFACMAVGWSLAAGASWPLYLGAAAVIGAGGSALAVYWLTLRDKTGGGPVYTSVSGGPSRGLTRLLDELSRRDFIYLVLVLALFGKANWFLALTAIGAPVFLVLVLAVALRDARRARASG